MKKLLAILAILMVFIFLFVGCKETTTPSTSAAPTSSAIPTTTTAAVPVSILGCPQGAPPAGLVPQYGGTLKILQDRTIANLGAPWRTRAGFENPMGRFAIENLIGLDAKGQPIPQLATSWDADMANKTVTFTLRQGVKFHDGTPFNAAAAKWCLDKYRTGTLTDLKLLASVDVVDEYRIRLNLSGWDPLFIQQLSSSGAGKMVSPTAAEKMGDDIQRNPVGTGPFKIASFEPNVRVRYERFEDYWQKGLPYLDAVEIMIVADQVVRAASFSRGEANFLGGLDTINAKKLKGEGYPIRQNTSVIWGICADSKNADSPFADIRVRQGLTYAIDRDTAVNAIFEGFKPPTNQLAAPGVQAWDDTIKGYPYSEAKAQELLGQAGYSTDKPLTTKIVYTTDPMMTDLYTLIQGYFKKVGVNLNLEPLDNATTTKIWASGWKNHLGDYRLSYNGLEMQYSTSLTRNLSASQTTFVSVYIPDDYQALYTKMLVENDMAKRDEYYKQLNKMAIDDYCLLIPLYVSRNSAAVTPDVIDFGMNNGTVGEFLPERAWLKK